MNYLMNEREHVPIVSDLDTWMSALRRGYREMTASEELRYRMRALYGGQIPDKKRLTREQRTDPAKERQP
jgi:hypothetical protein